MKKSMWLASVLAAFLLAAGTVQAQSVGEKIQSLEQELQQLKEQQIELKKEATAAAAAMPSFSYRPGNGLNIEAADKAWSIRFALESHFRYNFESGRDQVGRTRGQLMGRRFRPGIIYCVNNCLWEFESTLDLDGWGTGNGKNNAATEVGSILQRGAVNFHAENLNPWLPMVQFGMEVQNAAGGSLARQGSGSTGAQAEYDLHTRNNGFNTGRAGSGIVLNWDDKDLSGIGIPGRIGKFQIGMSNVAEGDDGTQTLSDRQDFNLYLSVQPFAQVKNKWISGLTFEYGAWFCNVDNRADNGCSRYRIQDHGDGGRQTLFDTGSNSIGQGLHVAHGPGIVWNVGPYTLRTMGSFQTSQDRNGGTPVIPGQPVANVGRGHKSANSWLIGHDLFLWSPKGWLTGSSTQAGSVLIGTHFERVNMSCGDNTRTCLQSNSAGTATQAINNGEYKRVRVLLREWDLWYFIAPRMSMGVNILWYDSSNLRAGANQAARNLGVCGSSPTASCRTGVGGDWLDVMLNWRYSF